MPIIKWSPFFGESFDDMDRMFNNFMPSVNTNNNKNLFTPAIDIYEDKDNIVVETQLAGIDPEQVDISIENDILIIKGEGEKKSEVEEKDYYRKEIRRGSFYRSIQLPAHVAADKAKAESEDGVLKITVPKEEEIKKKIIKITTNKK